MNTVKNYTKVFRFGQAIADDIEIIIKYLEELNPNMEPNSSDAIRFAILSKALDIQAQREQPAPE